MSENKEKQKLLLDMKVDPGQELLRLDKYIQSKMEKVSRNKIQKYLEAGNILVNQKVEKSNYKVRPGDHIQVIDLRDERPALITPEDCMPPIEYEDAQVLIVNKPAGMVCHPGHGNYTGTLLHGLAHHYNKNSEEYDLDRFGLVHRIDKDTTGLLVVAKSEQAMRSLQKQFQDHTTERKYVALVWGDVPEDEGTIEGPIGRHPRHRNIFTVVDEHEEGKNAITHYKVLKRYGYVTLIECQLETGRTHQIRVHLKHIGHTLFGDGHYGGDKILKGTVFSKYKQFIENNLKIMPRQALHAKSLGFVHPETDEKMVFDSELPEDFQQVLEKWDRYTGAYGV